MNCNARKFYRCQLCGNLIGMIHDSGAVPVCCGQEMTLLNANSTDAAAEKHVPTFIIDGDTVTVKVGSAPHPMIKEHYIEWIYLFTENGGQRKCLAPDSPPEASFKLVGDKLTAVYAYCNLHGLWVKEA